MVFQWISHAFSDREMHRFTQGDNQHMRHNLAMGRYNVAQIWHICSREEQALLAHLVGMEIVFPWQPENCAITQLYESITSAIAQLYESILN